MEAEATSGAGEPADGSGFLDQVRALLASAAGYLQARLELAGLESKAALVHYLKLFFCLGLTMAGLFFGYIFAVLSAVLLLHYWFGWPVGVVALAAAAFHFLLAMVAALTARVLFMTPQFSATLAEFRKDKEVLQR